MGAVPAARWQAEQVFALAPAPGSIAAAQPLAVPERWAGSGCDATAVWGRCAGGGSEPYDCVVDHVGVGWRCTCPSRRRPCKHVLALLLLWVRGQVAEGEPPPVVAGWIAGRSGQVRPAPGPQEDARPAGIGDGPEPSASVTPPLPESRDPARERDERVARMLAGLGELDRWLDDRVRTGLADPALARPATWDHVAARLVDAQVGGLANRVRRVAALVGRSPEWHERVLAELGVLQLLVAAGRRLPELPPALADSVATALGWQVRQAEVLAGVPHHDDWVVMGRSDTREDRIEVRRTYLRGSRSGEWAMVLSFAAYQQRLDHTLPVGAALDADLFRYPGALGLRALVGRRGREWSEPSPIGAGDVPSALDEIGRALVAEPWLERWPVCLVAAPARWAGRWVLTDAHGSVPLAPGSDAAGLLACSEGRALPVTAEWTPDGLVPLTVHLGDRVVDVGPRADPSFVGAP